MRICIFGAGAIGSALAALLMRDGDTVTVIGRGEHIRTVAAQGLRTNLPNGPVAVRPVVATPETAEPADLLIVTLKSHQVPAAAADLARLLKPEGRALFVLNGIPWWYFHGKPGRFAGTDIPELDPEGRIRAAIGVERAMGGVIYLGAEVREPGSVSVTSLSRFAIGAIGDTPQPVLDPLAQRLSAAGLPTEHVADIRADVWMKLQGNAAMLPISALTCLRNNEMMNDPALAKLVQAIMGEVRDVAAAHGITSLPTAEARFEANRRIGGSKSSMLQDVERGRPLEIDAMLGAVLHLARMAGVATPIGDIVLPLIAARNFRIKNPL